MLFSSPRRCGALILGFCMATASAVVRADESAIAPLDEAAPPVLLRLAERLDSAGFDTPPGDELALEEIEAPLSLQGSTSLGETVVPARVLAEAMALVGTDYRLGAASEDRVDCSSLMQRIFRSVGMLLPRTAREMLHIGRPVETAEVRSGDLMFYRWQRRQLHVAVYLDDGHIVHASPAAGHVVITEITRDWERRLVAVRRVI